jgi:hypothetical protein
MFDKEFIYQHLVKAQKGFENCVAIEYFEHRTPRRLSPFNMETVA